MEVSIYTAVKHCRICVDELPDNPRPIFRVDPRARIVLLSQAPGRIAHESGVAWDDPGGKRLREWLGVSDAIFFESPYFAILPMGLCYPGKGKGGDLPPFPICAPNWHQPLLSLLPNRSLTILIGRIAQQYYLKETAKSTLTETVRSYQMYAPDYFPVPHPSPRNRLWLRRNPWFEERVLPDLRWRVREILPNF